MPGDNGAEQFTFYFTDIELLGEVPSTTPEPLEDRLLFSSVTADEDYSTQFTGVESFGNGATFNFQSAVDPASTYDRVGSVLSGEGYAADINVAFAAFTALGTGFASGYEAFSIKVRETPNGRLEVKLIGVPQSDSVADIVLDTYEGATDLGNGWYNVVIPFDEFTNPNSIPNHSGYLIGMPGDNGAEQFTFYFTDIELLGEAVIEPQEVVNNFNSAEGIITFGGTQTALVVQDDAPVGSSGSVIEAIKPDGAETWAGATIATLLEGEFIATANTEVSLRVWSPEAGKTIRLKLEDASDDTKVVETDVLTTEANGWQTLVFDFSQQASGTASFNDNHTYNKASVFFDFNTAGNGQTYYFDDLSYTLFPV
jgi:hypothetical protein